MTSFDLNDVTSLDPNMDAEDATVLANTMPPALPPGIAANIDLLIETVPEGGVAAPTEADRDTWTKALAAISAIKVASELRTRVAGWTEFAMGVLLYWHSPDKGFSYAFGDGKLTKPSSNRPFACAASAIYNINSGDSTNRNANSKRVNSKATQFDSLMKLLLDQNIRIGDLPLSRDSVQQLVAVIEQAGGLNAMERLKWDEKDPHSAPEPIELDPQLKSDILRKLALSALQDGGDSQPRLVFVHKREDGTQQELPVPDSVVNLAVVAQAPTPPRTEALAELFVMGGCVLPEPTDELKNQGSDPNDRRTQRRIDERQVVWGPDGRITQSLLKARNGTVVVECWNRDPTLILGDTVKGHARLYTELRKRMEVNILPLDRRPVFDVEVEATDKKSGLGMLKVSTAANPGEPIRALLQRLTGEGYVDVDPPRLKESARCVMLRGVFYGFASAYVEKAVKAVRNASKTKNGSPQEPYASSVEFGGEGISLLSPKADAAKKLVVGSVEGSGNISVRLV